ncbi:MAG: hypothetical protein QM572_15340 [Nocardioides sp.]|uniref:HD domain-containing protein n=1 Tax=Nocardioides sp. TaxID=35761 RepID=UPI0039E67AB3
MELPQHRPDHWPLTDADPLRDELLTAYAADDRRFHGLRHLGEVLDHLDALSSAGERFDRLPVLLGAWFHDSLYDGERDSEERAASWARAALADHVDGTVIEEVARLVLLTDTHDPAPGDANGAALSDADLAILASGPERYADYLAAVRAEFAQLSDEEFARGREHLVERLLDRPSIYRTAHGRATWERAARDNLRSELGALRPVG